MWPAAPNIFGILRQTCFFVAFFRARDFENRVFHVKMIQMEIVNVLGRWKCEFLRICWGPDGARFPAGPPEGPGGGPGEGATRAQGLRRVPLGPQGLPRAPARGPKGWANKAPQLRQMSLNDVKC